MKSELKIEVSAELLGEIIEGSYSKMFRLHPDRDYELSKLGEGYHNIEGLTIKLWNNDLIDGVIKCLVVSGDKFKPINNYLIKDDGKWSFY